MSANTQNARSAIQLFVKNKGDLVNICSDLSSVRLNDENNTYKNNQIDKDGRAGGLAWLGYRLDMAGITRSIAFGPLKIVLKLSL